VVGAVVLGEVDVALGVVTVVLELVPPPHPLINMEVISSIVMMHIIMFLFIFPLH